MVPRRLRACVWVTIAALVSCGCHSGDADPYPTWTPEPKSFTPRADSPNAFDAYALAALDAEDKGGDSLSRVSFYPGHKLEAEAAIKGAVQKVIAASKGACDFQFVTHRPFQPSPYQSGWRLIGRVLKWYVEDACQANNYDLAITYANAGTHFGFGLTGGGATDASLGLSIVDDLRKAIAPAMTKMSAEQLDRLAAGIKSAFDTKPAIAVAIKHERENTLLMIQYIQDAVRARDLKTVGNNLGPDVKEALQYLEGISDNTSKRKAYFEGLAKATEAEMSAVEQDSELAVSARKVSHAKIDAPWKKLIKHVYGTARPLLEINDATVARTRLLVLYAEIMRIHLRTKAYPPDLTGFTAPLTVDPYSGSPFIYHVDVAQFSIYSVGPNGQDDGGDTDSSYTKPDLRLELPNQ